MKIIDNYLNLLSEEENSGKYDILVNQWNRSVLNSDLPKSYYLKQGDPSAVVRTLNRIVKRFYTTLTPKMESELQKVTHGRDYSFFMFYYRFLKKHSTKKKISFNTSQSSLEIKNTLRQLTGGGINTKALSIIASMGSPRTFFDLNKEYLWREGMSRNVRSSEGLKDLKGFKGVEKYPNIGKSIKISRKEEETNAKEEERKEKESRGKKEREEKWSRSQEVHKKERLMMFGKYLAIGVVVVLLSIAAYKVYKNFFTKAARACKGKSGREKDVCMAKFRLAASIKGKQAFIKNRSLISRTKDEKAKTKFKEEIQKWDKRINKTRTSLAKLNEGL